MCEAPVKSIIVYLCCMRKQWDQAIGPIWLGMVNLIGWLQRPADLEGLSSRCYQRTFTGIPAHVTSLHTLYKYPNAGNSFTIFS